MKAPECVDCIRDGVAAWRPTPHGGPRSRLCVTHHRARRKATRAAAHARRLGGVYEMTPQKYAALKAFQGGKCAVCQKATGASKNLAVDHDHDLARAHGHDPKNGCPACWRGLLCGPCNKILGVLDVAGLTRAIQYLLDPPARRLFVP